MIEDTSDTQSEVLNPFQISFSYIVDVAKWNLTPQREELCVAPQVWLDSRQIAPCGNFGRDPRDA